MTASPTVADADAHAAAAHLGQTDKAGRPYIEHPRAVAAILAEQGHGDYAVMAGLLHDVVEDTNVTLDDLSIAGYWGCAGSAPPDNRRRARPRRNTMTDTTSLNRPYQAARDLLSGCYNGDIGATAECIARIVAAQQERHGMRYMQRLTQSYAARQAIVVQLAGMAEAEGVRGGAAHAHPLLDGAVAVAAKALWEEPS